MVNKNVSKINIYGQDLWHDEALVLGSRESLKKLRNAIDGALERGRGTVEVAASDGDKYDLVVKIKEEDDLDWGRLELPYRESFAKGDTLGKVSKQDILKYR